MAKIVFIFKRIKQNYWVKRESQLKSNSGLVKISYRLRSNFLDAPVTNWWTNWDNQIAFSRGNRAFLAINKSGYDMSGSFATGLPEGSYCNVNAGDVVDNKCSGTVQYSIEIRIMATLFKMRPAKIFISARVMNTIGLN